MQLRLNEIGGLDEFRAALEQIPRVDFLSGRIQPKDGSAPFRLDLERLLSTGSGTGDVLAKLIDMVGEETTRKLTLADLNARMASMSPDQQHECFYSNSIAPKTATEAR